MEIRVLGCSGGIGVGRHTTALALDGDVLIDCGSGVGELSGAQMGALRHVFLTHSHLDHTAFLPLLVDSVFERLQRPLMVHALPQTIQALREHIFNWVVWPDFTTLPTPDDPVLAFRPMEPGEVVELEGGRTVEMIPVAHTVPTVGYRVADAHGHAWAFSGDTGPNDTFWDTLNARDRLDLLIVECAFSEQQAALAGLSRHYCPSRLAHDLGKLRHRPRIVLSHLKPGAEDTIYRECRARLPHLNLERLRGGEIFRL